MIYLTDDEAEELLRRTREAEKYLSLIIKYQKAMRHKQK